ncbi:hypothetical protein [Vibrio bathopelagicus]|uniref:hypothetical protein n=1 Tax=Vibrio bathopelagicus TaxID=2777577 RepID=UPI001863E528|nr:hypothetical protein [Vibrio bathopelagicus]
MKLKLLSTAIAATFLAGCSSSGSSDNGTTPGPQVGVADVVYNEDLNTAYIIGDEGNNAVVIGDGQGNAVVTVNGEIFTIQGDVVVNANGDIVGTVVTDDGIATVYINDKSYTLAVENGRLIIEGSELDPEFGDDEWGPSAGNEFFANYMIVDELGMPVALIEGDNGNYMWVIKGDDAYFLNINGSDAKPTHKIVDGEVLTMSGESTGITVETHRTEGQITHLTFNTPRGEEIVIRHEDGRLVATVFGHGHEHEGPDSAPTYGDIDDVLGTTIITLDNGETLILKDGVLYHPSSDSGAVFNADGTITNMDGEVIARAEMQEVGFVVSLENGAEITFRNDNGRLFAAITGKPNVENPIERPAPINPIEGEASIELPTIGFDLEDDILTVTLLDGTEVMIKDNGIAGGTIIGPEGKMSVSKATMDAYKEAADLLTIDEQKSLVAVFLVNQSGDAIDNDARLALWQTQKDSTLAWAKQSPENTAKMLHIIAIEVDELGKDPYSLGYYLLTGKKQSIDDIKDIAQEKVRGLSDLQKQELKQKIQSLSQEQRQQIKQAVKDRASRS